MNKSVHIVVTGAAGFIGSCMTGFLNENGYENLILVDEFSRIDKENNLGDKRFTVRVERDDFFSLAGRGKNRDWLGGHHLKCKNETQPRFDYASCINCLNLEYSAEDSHGLMHA